MRKKTIVSFREMLRVLVGQIRDKFQTYSVFNYNSDLYTEILSVVLFGCMVNKDFRNRWKSTLQNTTMARGGLVIV